MRHALCLITGYPGPIYGCVRMILIRTEVRLASYENDGYLVATVLSNFLYPLPVRR
jgi:hypothetical protein